MSRENDETIAVYNSDVKRYVERFFSKDNDDNHRFVEGIIGRSLKNFPKDIAMFEIGAGPGEYAEYIESLGFKIEITDVADSFVEYLKSRGHVATKFNLITDDFAKKYDFILAIAVLLHLTKPEVIAAVKKIYGALNWGGVFVFSIKTGDGEEFVDNGLGAKRYFNYYQSDEILKVAHDAGFSIIETNRDNEVEPGKAHFYVAVRKEKK
ncbi:class I SAM-dependent methyltransferase [Candidatus Saccharibacteria bacterium]|nr:class I SAM-dependent methyltransferase [Candidatus Saccharibacteria bacterium]MCL1962929.1 class I SAM-dependent methyltransferase [Candidatus Saccharibacteria bacterium]